MVINNEKYYLKSNWDSEEYAEKILKFALRNGCQYCDVRAETTIGNGFLIENGEMEHIRTSDEHGLGIRVLVDGAWGFYSTSNPLFENMKDAIHDTIQSTKYVASQKKQKVKLANVPTVVRQVNFPVREPNTIEDLIKIGFECDKIIHDKKRIIKSFVSIKYKTSSKFFINSEDTRITQNFTDTIADLMATAHESGLTQSVNITEGGRGGMESITKKNNVLNSAEFISQKASELIDAKAPLEEKTTVVMNPDFVALLSHEILGHPSEADRVIGKEMAWAGGAWWAGKLGEKIGSENLTVIDDPTMEGTLGCFKYDDEGVESTKKTLIQNGILKTHMHSRETAQIFNVKPNSSMRATSYQFMPLIRMACTCIDAGDWDPQEIISDVKDGFLISNMKVPSIDMMRYNWSISCQYAQKIENGELTELLRDVIVMGIAPEFFSSIDACGKDFTVRPITNCGKGDPMQSMVMGNGGPTIRGVATVKSV